MILSKLLQSINIYSTDSKEGTLEISKIAYHSDEVSSDTLFVCIRGYETDGHTYAKEAVEKGATALVVERKLDDVSVPQFVVKDSRRALATLSDAFLEHPSQALSVFGVTGTNGKTSITYMTDAIFKAHQLKTGLIGTVMIKIDDKVEPSSLTTPESLDLQHYLADMREADVSHVSMEVSSSALDLKRVANVDFDVVAFTNINKDHIELHGSFDAYYNAKASLIRNASKQSVAILNIDQPLLEKLGSETEATVVTFGLDNTKGNLSVSDIDLSSGRPSFTVNINTPIMTLGGNRIDPVSFGVDLTIPGHHSIYNALTAIAVGLVNGVPISTIKKGIEKFNGVERRFHILYDEEFTIVDDLFLNENNIESSMKALENLSYQSIHIVHAVRGNNGPVLNKENAEKMAHWFSKLKINRITLTVSQSHVKKKDQVKAEELNAFLDVMESEGISVDFHNELCDALSSSLAQVNTGDILLITGARGMDYGAKTILELLLEKKPGVEKQAITDVLDKKMVGMDDLMIAD
ncbi:MAG: UDP-N-acetylmuramyl-tripeptide synthetase [Alkalibacterium sp.]|nr:UDP-N-acetylmuramyl-tripeptide synthetase [Alkalibacterium sp.]